MNTYLTAAELVSIGDLINHLNRERGDLSFTVAISDCNGDDAGYVSQTQGDGVYAYSSDKDSFQ